MAEPKRLQLDATKTLQREKKVKEVPPTYRFELKLNDKATEFAEFSYAELVKEARNQEWESKQPGSDDPFSLDEDVELQEIARRFEEKYNPKPGRKKKKKLGLCEDFIDKGMGYDETDPFIDNEEAYDELVPSTLTTEYGGFYINKGDLEFRNLSESECNYENKPRKKRIKQGTDKEKKKRRVGFEENQKRRGRKPLNEALSALKPKKKAQPTVADMLQQHKANLQRMQEEGLQQMQLDPIKVDREYETEEIDDNETDVSEVPGHPSSISEAIESVIKAAAEDGGSNTSVGPVTGSSDGEEAKIPIESIEAPKLPDNLPPELDEVLEKLKVAAYKSEEGKCKFFSDEVNRMLLSVELKAQELTSAQRSTIYAHLASHLPCTKETLQKRAKKLRLDQEDGKLREPMQRLKDGIAAVMPEMLEKYAALEQACNAREEEKKNGVITGTDGEESGDEEGDKKVSRIPKKRFEWNDTIRKYLCDVVRIKLKCYEVSKTRIQSAEEYLKHFLEAEVKNLWPPGWMQSRILFRESRAAHFYITNRPKKQMLVSKKNTNPLNVMMNVKPAVSLLNNTMVSQESEFDQIFPDKSVPFIPPVENVLEKAENMDLLTTNHGISAEERAAEFAKLFTLPIKSSAMDESSFTKTAETVTTPTGSNKLNSDLPPPKTSSPLVNAISDSGVQPKTAISKSDKQSKSNQQNKLSHYNSKVSDFNTFTEGSLASDMLARIICASLADYPYAGSHNIESTAAKVASVISPNPTLIKEPRNVNSKFSNDILASPKKADNGKQYNTDSRKPSQESGLPSFSKSGISIDSFLNSKNQTISRANDIVVKSKGLPTETSNAVNLKLKDSIVPHSRQFAEAFERTADTPPVSKKHSIKGLNIHTQVSPVSSVSASSRLLNEHISDYPSSTSPRSTLESAQKIAFDLAKYNSVSSQGSASAPYKKRTKYSQSSKVGDQWNHHFLETSLGTSLLEGMKGFPFPVGSMPTPPPAHSSSPHRTPAHSQHNSPRGTSHISPGLRSLHESKSDSPNQNSQSHSTIISTSDVQRRQSLIQGPWKSSPSQSPSTSLSHYMASTSPPISNQSKTTSPNHSSNSIVNISPAPAHSMSQIEKVTSAYSRSHSPLPLRASPSHLSLNHSTKTSSNTYSPHLGQTPYTTHQSSHTVSPTLHQQTVVRSNAFDSSNPITTSSSPTGTFTINQEVKTVNPRTN
ncbi:ubinuclein-2-like [Argiope bruennichi]|nr:ubinuclein-2-like [Argiope bruennichi]